MKPAVKITKKNDTEKYVTNAAFEKHARSTALSFANLENAISTVLKQIQIMNEESREHRLAMSALTHSDVKQERAIDELFERVERIERKLSPKI